MIRWGAIVMLLFACKAAKDAPAPLADKPATPAAVAATEVWDATLVLPTELRDLVVTFTQAGDKWTAQLDIPHVTKHPVPLSDVTFAADRIAFTIQKPGGKQTWEVYELTRQGGTASGVGKIGGAEMVIRMARADRQPAELLFPRPQTPKPPFPYEAREVVVDAPDGGKLAGTLTIPTGTGPFPAMLLLSGSGQQDRDETIFAHKSYLVMSDRLTRTGFVTLRFDDRGTGKTVGAVGTLDTEIADGGALVAFLKAQKEVDPKRIGIMGHSTGGMVAPNVAVNTKSVAFIVSLAGPTISGRELVPLQIEAAARIAHAPEESIREGVALQTKIGEAVAKDVGSVKALLAAVTTPELAKALGRTPTQAEIDQAIAKPLADAIHPWTVSFFKLDPRAAWKQLAIPVLLVVGDKDTQVPADITIKTLEATLSKPALATTKKLPGLNHLFQHAKTGLVDEYALIDETFDPATLDLIVSWLKEQAKLTR